MFSIKIPSFITIDRLKQLKANNNTNENIHNIINVKTQYRPLMSAIVGRCLPPPGSQNSKEKRIPWLKNLSDVKY